MLEVSRPLQPHTTAVGGGNNHQSSRLAHTLAKARTRQSTVQTLGLLVLSVFRYISAVLLLATRPWQRHSLCGLRHGYSTQCQKFRPGLQATLNTFRFSWCNDTCIFVSSSRSIQIQTACFESTGQSFGHRCRVRLQNFKIKTKLGHWAQNQVSAMTISVPWPEPYRK